MIEAIATVVATKPGIVSVEYKRSSACGHCKQASTCHVSAIAKEEEKNNIQVIDVACSLALDVGQQVRVGIPENGLLKGALLVYILPLFFIIMGAAVGQFMAVANAEWPSITGAFLGGCLGFLLMRLKSAKLTQSEYKPVILGVTIPVISEL
jgi:sigma-E factor negative regulatory protein RseC